MPELPEVETIRRDLAKKIVGGKIRSVEVRDKKLGDTKSFAKFLLGKKVVAAERIGKLLILKISGGNYLLIHLKMTGQLVYEDQEELLAGGHQFIKNSPLERGVTPRAGRGVLLEEIGGKLPNKYTRFILNFTDGRKLFFNDTRRFGYVRMAGKNDLAEIKAKYGIEPLRPEFTPANLKKILSGRRVPVKSILMDQQKISGIGNIYASEILFDAGVYPHRLSSRLKEKEIAAIFRSANKIIKKAVKHRGTTFSDYVDTSGKKGNFSKLLQVYEREGENCFGCGGKIKKIKIAGRSTYFCPACQK